LIQDKSQIVLSCFDYTGNMVKPWADAGYECWIVDLQHEKGEHKDGNIVRVGCDMLEFMPPRRDYKITFFAPPCTDLAVSGARWFAGKGLKALSSAIMLFFASTRIAEWCEAPYLIENPVSTISSYWRKPDFTFQPWEYGANYSKKTCLWIGNGLKIPPPPRFAPKTRGMFGNNFQNGAVGRSRHEEIGNAA
jgi:hypothetical protein